VSFFKRLFGKPDRKGAEEQVAQGAIAARQGQLKAALAHYEKAIQLDKTYPLARLNLALALQDAFNKDRKTLDADEKQQRLHAIVDALQATLDLDDACLPAWRSLGVANLSLKSPIKAEEALAKWLELADEEHEHRIVVQKQFNKVTVEADAERQLLYVIQLAERLEDDEADDVDDDELRAVLLEVDPVIQHALTDEEPADGIVRVDVFFAAALLYKKLEHPERARQLFEAVLQHAPHHDRALLEAATLCLNLGDLDAALQHSMTAYRLDPTDAGVTCNVGVCFLGQGVLDKAGEFIELAKELDPKDPIVGRAYDAWQQAVADARPPA